MYTYNILSATSTVLAVSSVGLLFLSSSSSSSSSTLYAFLVFPTLSFLHNIFVFLAVPSPVTVAARQRVKNERRQQCALSEPLSEIETSTLNLLLLALFTVLAIASGVASWFFAAINLAGSTTPAAGTSTPSWRYFDAPPSPMPSSFAPPRRNSSLAATIWVLQGGSFLAQAIVLASMFAIAAREAKIETVASQRGCPYEAGHFSSDVEQLMCVDENVLGAEAAVVPSDNEEEK